MASAEAIGRYRLFGIIASGGLATVHYGRQLGDNGFARTVAIKRLHPWLAGEPEVATMLLDEARLTARIRHPSVVSVTDVVQVPGQVLLVMDYVHGESFARLLDACRLARTPVPAEVALGVVVPVLHGLHAAHVASSDEGLPLRIVHRDVSPDNIIVGEDGCARVVDFGIAHAMGRLQHTREGDLKGKPAYMAPEQVLGHEVDARTDVFAASVVLWEALTMRRLFRSDNEVATAMRVLNSAIDPPSRIAADVPRALDAIVLRGLERDRDRRWPTAREMALALEETLPPASSSQVATWVRLVAGDVLHERTEALAQVESWTAEVPAARRSQLGLVAGALLVVLGGAGALAVSGFPNKGSSVEPAPLHAAPTDAAIQRSAEAPSAAPRPTVQAARVVGPAPPAPRRANAPAKRPNCDPPYQIKDGIQVFKRECL